jgi:hypothetical protein
MTRDDPSKTCLSLRRTVYGLLIVASLATTTGRILAVRSAERDTPFLSANDRSRWCTIRAVVDHGTYAIDEVIRDKGWDTIDKVRHADRDGQPHYYSSKPTLLPTLLAGPYWIVRNVTQRDIKRHPFYVGRILLFITNVIPLAVYFGLLVRIVERYGATDWGRVFVIAVAAWGTYLTAFAVTLNNHLPAAICVLIAVYGAMRIWYDGERRGYHFALVGLFAGLAAANELPALSLVAMLGAGLLWTAVRPTLFCFTPALALVVAGLFGTNYAAHGTFQMPYAQRHVEGGWYDFEGSYWYGPHRKGVDRGEPSRARYATHVMIGHHGILSLTPVWLISVVGLTMLCTGRDDRFVALAWLTLVLSIVCLIFYIGLRPTDDCNYGGVAIGFRWMFWFTPLWLITMLPAADRLAALRWGRSLAVLLLGISVVSVTYSPLNPWSHPWMYQYWETLGWVQ